MNKSETDLGKKGWDTSDPNNYSDGRQVAMWLKNATVGSFVVMRHEYPNCQYCPKRLKDENGKYIGPVYVIGVVKRWYLLALQKKKKLPRNSVRSQAVQKDGFTISVW